jgi:hypothetical protein
MAGSVTGPRAHTQSGSLHATLGKSTFPIDGVARDLCDLSSVSLMDQHR